MGQKVEKYIISQSNGLQMDVISYGGIITSLKVPSKDGVYEDVVLSLDSVSQYETSGILFWSDNRKVWKSNCRC